MEIGINLIYFALICNFETTKMWWCAWECSIQHDQFYWFLHPIESILFFFFKILNGKKCFENDSHDWAVQPCVCCDVAPLSLLKQPSYMLCRHRIVEFTVNPSRSAECFVQQNLLCSVWIKCCNWKIVLESMHRNSLNCMLVLILRTYKQQIKPSAAISRCIRW